MKNKSEIWIAEDDRSLRWVMEKAISREGMDVRSFETGDDLLSALKGSQPEIIISDIRMPGIDGLELLKEIHGKHSDIPIIITTAHSDLDSAVAAYQGGAFEYLPKPFDLDELVDVAHRAISFSRQQKSAIEAVAPRPMVQEIIGEAPAMQEVFRAIGRLSNSNITVLINGESGTGKELVAQALHKHSPRKTAKFIALNMAAIPHDLIESELFGHEKGAFTGATATRTGLVEAANSSTLFLDEIGELPLEAQARLLRVLQENEIRKVGSVQSKKVDVRLVVATHRDLKQLVVDGQFREDLYYRINVMTLLIPPLRDRGNDILELADAILQRTCTRLKTAMRSFSGGASRAIAIYTWPGNVRELENAIERAVVLSEGDEIGEELLAIDDEAAEAELASNQETTPILSEPIEELSLEDYFQRFVLEHQDSMNETQLAKKLGISRKCLWERRQRFGIPRKKKQAV